MSSLDAGASGIPILLYDGTVCPELTLQQCHDLTTGNLRCCLPHVDAEAPGILILLFDGTARPELTQKVVSRSHDRQLEVLLDPCRRRNVKNSHPTCAGGLLSPSRYSE